VLRHLNILIMKTIVFNSISGAFNPDGTINLSSVKKNPVTTVNLQLRINKIAQRMRDNLKREYFSDHSLQRTISFKEFVDAKVKKHLSNYKTV
jgi:hypothetical protein